MVHVLMAMVPALSVYLAAASRCLGGAFMVSLCADIVTFLALPFDILYGVFLGAYRFEIKCIRSCGALMRSKKYNQLKRCVDTLEHRNGDSLFVGVVLFAILVFLVP